MGQRTTVVGLSGIQGFQMRGFVKYKLSCKPALYHFGAFLAWILCSFTSLAASSGQFVIVSRGQPKAEIVAEANQPELPVAFAAQELQRYVKEMSGRSWRWSLRPQ